MSPGSPVKLSRHFAGLLVKKKKVRERATERERERNRLRGIDRDIKRQTVSKTKEKRTASSSRLRCVWGAVLHLGIGSIGYSHP